MNDITAVVLSVGERTTERAIRSVRRQSVEAKELLVIRDITPYYRAMNHAASRVKTDYFVVVDADMVLDKNCVEQLRENMLDGVGIAMGALRDPLMGTENGIKMYNKKCFEKARFKNTVSSDTDFFDDICKHGWKVKRISESTDDDRFKRNIHTFGDHLPEYDEVYVFRRYFLLGRRYHYRNDPQNLKKRLFRLAEVNHEYSAVAQIALAHGIFSNDNGDMLNPLLYIANEDFRTLKKFIKSNKEGSMHGMSIETKGSMNTEELFRFYYKLAIEFKAPGTFGRFNEYMKRVDEIHNAEAWIAKIGLAEGIFSGSFCEDEVKQKFNHLMKLMT